MPIGRYGTDYERYLGSGVILLSQIAEHPHPDKNFHVSPQCVKQIKTLERKFRTNTCKPWLPENRFKAEISEASWAARIEHGTLAVEEDLALPYLEFAQDAQINITEGIPLLQAARAAKVWGIARLFQPCNEKWWAVDFFCDDGSRCKAAKEASVHSQLRPLFTGLTEDDRLPLRVDIPGLGDSLNEDIHLTRCSKGIVEALNPSFRLESFWITPSLNYFATMRKCWCTEEIINYLNYMSAQWARITLDWQPQVIAAANHDTVRTLESMAPAVSSSDRAYVLGKFEAGELFPSLTDPTLRHAVQDAVCNQGPILTINTFAKDLRLLKSRIHEPLKPILGRMSRTKMDTVRSKIRARFQLRFQHLVRHQAARRYGVAQQEAFVERCYEVLFLRLMRTATPLDGNELDRIAHQEMVGCHPPDESQLLMPPDSDLQPIEAKDRHGTRIATAMASLSGRRLLEPCGLERLVSRSFMANYVTSIFLLGVSAANVPATAHSPLQPKGSLVATSRGLAVQSDTPTSSACSLESHSSQSVHSCGGTDYAWSDYQQRVQTVPVRYPERISNGERWHSVHPRDSSVASVRSRVSLHQHSASPIDRRLDRVQSAAFGSNPSLSSPLESISESGVERQQQNNETQIRAIHHLLRAFPASDCLSPLSKAMSPSVYSSPGEWNSCDASKVKVGHDLASVAQQYANLVPPFPAEPSMAGTPKEAAPQGDADIRPSVELTLAETARVPDACFLAPSQLGANVIRFQSTKRRNLVYTMPTTTRHIRRFVDSQYKADPTTTFSYELDGETRIAASESALLEVVHRLNTVFVESDVLGSTEGLERQRRLHFS